MRHLLLLAPRLLLLAWFLAIAAPATAAAGRQDGTAAAPVAERLARVRAQVLAGQDHLPDVITELRSILATDPSLAEAHMLLGVAYRGMGTELMNGEAKAELTQALALDPGLFAARLLLAQVYFDLGRYENVRDEANAALAQVPRQPQFLALLGEAERRLGNPARAAELSRLALQSDASMLQAHYYLGLALLDLGQRDDAIQQLAQVASSGAKVGSVYLSLGTAYLDAGRVDEAIGALTLGTRVDPSLRDIRIQLAHAYRSKGALDLAAEQLTLADPPGLPMQITAAYQHTQTNLSFEWGQLRLQQGRLAAAAAAFRKALDMDPNHGPSHRSLAEVYLRQGSYALARGEATRAEALGSPVAADVQERLRRGPAGGRP